jgi:N-acetylglutamate synthase-like GNAT family acetyltransferase
MQLRKAELKDADAACAVLRRSITELCGADHNGDAALLEAWLANKTSERVQAWIVAPCNFMLVAEIWGAIAGVAAMNDQGHITLNYVSPDYRFRGVSKALLTELETRARELGLESCTLDSTKTARAFYSAAGFKDVPNLEGSCGRLSCYGMIKRLPPPTSITSAGVIGPRSCADEAG